MADIQFYIDGLRSRECHCGNTKKEKHSFCYPCYSSLPTDMQRDLWQQIGCGYEEAYEDAVTYLDDLI